MSIWEKCYNLNSNTMFPKLLCEEDSDKVSLHSPSVIKTTLPDFLQKNNKFNQHNIGIYYISDLHLDQHILASYGQGVQDEKIVDYIDSVARKLLTGDIESEIRAFKSPVVFFGGDIASCFLIAKAFYSAFIQTWKNIVDDSYNSIMALRAPIEKELHECNEIIEKWENKRLKGGHITEKMLTGNSLPKYIITEVLRRRELYRSLRETEQGLAYGWAEKYKDHRSSQYIYAILGNHEMWDFSTFEECSDAYSKLLKELGIRFLNDGVTTLGSFHAPWKRDEKTQELLPLNQGENSESFDLQMLSYSNAIIVGGVGYAAKNDDFNANHCIYGEAVCPEKEKQLSDRWIKAFRKAQTMARRSHATLVVLTHTPVYDWLDSGEVPSNCVFFSGHTHKNFYNNWENNTYIFSDNQIGYESKRFAFKHATIYKPRNPFASDPDGYRTITLGEFREFYRYMNTNFLGTGTLEYQMEKYDAKLIMIKQQGYYGFFLTSSKGMYICNGGSIKKIDKTVNLDMYNRRFLDMVRMYLLALSPLRRAQEQVAEYVRSIGGSGTIHGTIVDIDSLNHIMFNVEKGTITFYNSPIFGLVIPYPDIRSLLHDHNPILEQKLLESGGSELLPAVPSEPVLSTLETVDIKNSPYALSRRVNALQRLFDNHVLRDWNNEVLEKGLRRDSVMPILLE